MKKYYAGYIGEQILKNHSTEKAFYVDYDVNGFGQTIPVWFPKSQCKFEAANDCGNVKVYIPAWLIAKVRYNFDYKRVNTIIWCCNDERLIVEM